MTMETDLVSVIIPVYNAEKYLRKCLGSIINQTYGYLDIIMVNDGSNDRSGDICNEYSSIDARIKVIHTENRGVSAARNLGIMESVGKYVQFVDADDYIQRDMIETMLFHIEYDKYELIISGYNRVFLENRNGPKIYQKNRLSGRFTIDEFNLNFEIGRASCRVRV